MISMQAERVQEHMDEEQRWQAVLARRREADGTFVFAVRSTGIYCRPSCPARRPQRQQVLFFSAPQDAEVAGFRACRRCRPRLETPPEPNAELMEQVCDYIEEHLDLPLRLSDLGQEFHLSPYHLQRTFKRVKGVTPRQYAESRRLERFKTHLHEGESVTEAQYSAGYQSSSTVYERAQSQLGMMPRTYRRGGKGMHITYGIAQCALGYILLAATPRGVAALRLGDDASSLEAGLVREYPAAELARDDEGVRPWITLLLDYIQGQPLPATVPFDVQATAFQWKVWDALRRIPAGQTRTYQQVAREIGQPTAARAVAHACATNPIALFIPCHRVVRGDGGLGGYRWGIERKRELLVIERAAGAMSETGSESATIRGNG